MPFRNTGFFVRNHPSPAIDILSEDPSHRWDDRDQRLSVEQTDRTCLALCHRIPFHSKGIDIGGLRKHV